MMDKEKIKEGVKLILEGIGEDPFREGLRETPDRVAKSFEEICSGLDDSAEYHLSKQFEVENNDMILERDISFYSLCEHHLLPFFGKVHIAYVPDKRVAGLSKIARTVNVYAGRLQIQERMTAQIADAVMAGLSPKGVIVLTEAEHTCMTMRGVKKPGSKTVTVVSRGAFAEDPSLQERFFRLLLSD